MRSRWLKHDFWKNEQLGACEPTARLFFVGLWAAADREGRLEDRPHKLRAEILPYDASACGEALLEQLLKQGLVLRYQVNGRRLLWIPTFRKHQQWYTARDEARSKLPPHPDDPQRLTPTPGGSLVNPRRLPGNPSSGNTGNSCIPGNTLKEELPKTEVCSEPAEARRSEPPAVLVFPTVGKGPKEWNLTEAKLAEYQESFPGVNVLAECKKARQWCMDNPTKRKTARGMPAFLTRWLGKVQDSGRGGAGTPPAPRKSREDSRQEVLDQWLRTRQNTSPGASTTPTDSGSATPTPDF